MVGLVKIKANSVWAWVKIGKSNYSQEEMVPYANIKANMKEQLEKILRDG